MSNPGTASQVPAFAFGTAAARPAAAAGNAKTAYFATDTGEVTFSDGATWRTIAQTSATQFQATGEIEAQGGSVNNPTGDLFLKRFGAFVLSLQSGGVNSGAAINVTPSSGTVGVTVKQPGDTNPTFQIDTNGTLHWGAGGASALDTALTRTGAGYLALGNLRLAAADTGNTVYSTSGDLGLGSASGIISLQVRLRNAAAANEATAATAGTNGAPPAQVAGYMIFQDSNSVVRKIPYYAN